MPLPNFTVTGNLKEILGDVASNELIESAMTRAVITFESNVPAGALVKWGTSMYRLGPVVAEVNQSGNIVLADGTAVRLLAQDDGLNIRGLQWRVRIELEASVVPPLPPVDLRWFWFTALADSQTLNLRNVLPAVATPVSGTVPGGAGGVATWDELENKPFDEFNKLLPENLPDLAIIQFLGHVADETAMLAAGGQKGDWVIRDDTGEAWVVSGPDTLLLTSWTALPYPHVTWSTLTGKPTVVAAGADQAAARTSIGVAYGSTAGTVAQGNDSRLSDARTPTNGSVGITQLSATGTPGNTTFLRGDNVWATPAGGGGGSGITAVVQDTAPALGGDLSVGAYAVGAAAAADLTKLHALTATAVELNRVAGVTSAVQTQLDNKQASDADLTAIAGLTSAADKVAYATGAGAWAMADFKQRVRDIAAAASDAALLTALKVPSDFVYVATGSGVTRAVGSGDFTVGQYIGRAFTLTQIVYQFDTADSAGNTTVEVRRNSTAVTGSSLAVTATNQVDGTTTDAARTATVNQAFSVGDRLLLQVTGIGSTPGKGLRAYLLGVWN